jgi:hypothetical protein
LVDTCQIANNNLKKYLQTIWQIIK